MVRRGTGLLVGADRRWLLLDDVPDEAFVATLWETIAGSGVDRVLPLLESHYGDALPSLAMTGAGREITRGAGEVTTDRVGRDAEPRLVRDHRPATAAAPAVPRRGRVRGAGRDPGRRPRPDAQGGPGLIDGIPDEVLAAVGPDIPVRARQTAREAGAAA